MNAYVRNGYANRLDYLRELADINGADLQTVISLAEMLGPSEDFDGLVNEVEDFCWEGLR